MVWTRCTWCLLALLALGWAAGCSKAPEPPPEILIGATGYLSEREANSEGALTERAAAFVTAEVDAAGGIEVRGRRHPVKLIFRGFEDTPENAVEAVKRLINQDGVVAIVGPQASRNAIPAGAVAEASGIPMLSPLSTNPATTHGRRSVFRMSFLDDAQAEALARFSRETLGARTGAVLYEVSDPYSRGIAELFRTRFAEAGGQIVAFPSFVQSTRDYAEGVEDFTSELDLIRDSGAEVLVLPNRSADVLRQARQARQLGLQAVLLGTDSWDRTHFKAFPEFEGAFTVAHWTLDPSNAAAKAFRARYEKMHGTSPTDTPALTYDAFQTLFAAIRLADDLSPAAIRQALVDLPAIRGVSGSIDFVSSGDPVKSVAIMKFQDGEARFVTSVPSNANSAEAQ